MTDDDTELAALLEAERAEFAVFSASS